MSLLNATNLSKFYGPDEVFSRVTVEIPHKSRIALVGPNGAGKTTLINLLAGFDTPTEGTLQLAKATRIGFLPQRPELAGEHTLYAEALKAFADLRAVEQRLNALESAMADPDQHDAALAEYGPLQEKFERDGGYIYESKLRMVLTGLGFDEADFAMPLPRLSGGQRTRALLARLLLEAPDLLILDEPTNHLDIQAVEW
ncbi:ABC-F family ATP-binding cassette domain-containing protein, partial [bacterium]|nr:ABC-F family ATP-binding cassette domain-containing protein [bacterium]